MYKERMLEYYPPVVRSIKEFQAIVDTESTEMEQFANARDDVLNDAYLLTMGEERIKSWERIFGLSFDANATLQDRRETVIARLRSKGKLNTQSIVAIVNSFTGGTAKANMEDSTLVVKIQPPHGSKSFRFESVEKELSKNLPSHIGLSVVRDYPTWETLMNNTGTWSNSMFYYRTWEEVLLNAGLPIGKLDVTPLDTFILDLDKE